MKLQKQGIWISKESNQTNQKKSYKSYKSYKSLVKTDKEYMWHPVYEIEFSNGLKILWVKIDWKLVQLKPKEVNYWDLVQNELGEWMKDYPTKARNKWRADYYKATIKIV